jgi:hypothetical protein
MAFARELKPKAGLITFVNANQGLKIAVAENTGFTRLLRRRFRTLACVNR